MKQELLEEISRIRFLNKSVNSTPKNREFLYEQLQDAREILPAIKDTRDLAITRNLRNAEYLRTLELESKAIFDDVRSLTGGPLKTKDLKDIKSIQELQKALEADNITLTSLGQFNWSVFRKSTNPKIYMEVANDIVSTKTFTEIYQPLTRTEAIARLESRNLTNRQANILYDAWLKRVKTLEDLKTAEELKAAEEAKRAEQEAQRLKDLEKNKDVKPITPEEEQATRDLKDLDDLKKSNEDLNKELLDREKEIGDLRGDLGYTQRELRDAERELESMGRDLQYIKDNKPNGFMRWLGKRGIVDYATRSIKSRWLFKLAGLAGLTWLAWYIFFRDKGINPKCENDNEKFDEGKGKCVPFKGTEDGDDTIDTEDELPIYDIDEDPTIFVNCEGIYGKGCKDKGDDIERVQICLGVPSTGNFDKRTEDALYDKINKRTFTRSDIERICKSSSTEKDYSELSWKF